MCHCSFFKCKKGESLILIQQLNSLVVGILVLMGDFFFLEISEILENEQLIKQMDALGLPISFLSNKEVKSCSHWLFNDL